MQLKIWPDDYMAVVFDRQLAAGWPQHFITNYGCEPEVRHVNCYSHVFSLPFFAETVPFLAVIQCEDVVFVFGAIAADTGSAFAATWPKDASNLNIDRGAPVFDSGFTLAAPGAPAWLLNFTRNARLLPMFAPRSAENNVVLPDSA